jgi:hypothetical protein
MNKGIWEAGKNWALTLTVIQVARLRLAVLSVPTPAKRKLTHALTSISILAYTTAGIAVGLAQSKKEIT